jgi:hypothetical protein
MHRVDSSNPLSYCHSDQVPIFTFFSYVFLSFQLILFECLFKDIMLVLIPIVVINSFEKLQDIASSSTLLTSLNIHDVTLLNFFP